VVPFFAWQHLHVHMQAKGTATFSSHVQQSLGHRPNLSSQALARPADDLVREPQPPDF
jgi:hypothetical protein